MYFHLCYCTCLLSSIEISMKKKKLVYLSDDAFLEWHGDTFVDVRRKT